MEYWNSFSVTAVIPNRDYRCLIPDVVNLILIKESEKKKIETDFKYD